MAKRTSKRITSVALSKEKEAVKESAPVEPKKKIEKKPRTKKANSEIIKKAKPAVKSAEAKGEPVPEKAAPVPAEKEVDKTPVSKKAAPAKVRKERINRSAVRKVSPVSAGKPTLRSVYSNSKYTLLVLGFGSDFNTKKRIVIFSDLLTGQVHTIALSLWNRWKMKEVKKINTET